MPVHPSHCTNQRRMRRALWVAHVDAARAVANAPARAPAAVHSVHKCLRAGGATSATLDVISTAVRYARSTSDSMCPLDASPSSTPGCDPTQTPKQSERGGVGGSQHEGRRPFEDERRSDVRSRPRRGYGRVQDGRMPPAWGAPGAPCAGTERPNRPKHDHHGPPSRVMRPLRELGRATAKEVAAKECSTQPTSERPRRGRSLLTTPAAKSPSTPPSGPPTQRQRRSTCPRGGEAVRDAEVLQPQCGKPFALLPRAIRWCQISVRGAGCRARSQWTSISYPRRRSHHVFAGGRLSCEQANEGAQTQRTMSPSTSSRTLQPLMPRTRASEEVIASSRASGAASAAVIASSPHARRHRSGSPASAPASSDRRRNAPGNCTHGQTGCQLEKEPNM